MILIIFISLILRRICIPRTLSAILWHCINYCEYALNLSKFILYLNIAVCFPYCKSSLTNQFLSIFQIRQFYSLFRKPFKSGKKEWQSRQNFKIKVRWLLWQKRKKSSQLNKQFSSKSYNERPLYKFF